MRKFIFIILLVTVHGQGISQHCTDNTIPSFNREETLHYVLHYNWGILWVEAGEVTFEAKDTIIDNNPNYILKAHGTSMPKWDWFYKVDSKYLSLTNSQLKPYYFSRIGQEGKYMYNNKYVIKTNSAEITETKENGEKTIKEFSLEKCTFDVMSAVYYCRSIPFQEYLENDLIPLNLILDGASHESSLRYLGKKKWTNPKTDITYDCIIFSPQLVEGTVFEEGESMLVYVTDDAFRTPVYVESDLVVGKAKVFLIK